MKKSRLVHCCLSVSLCLFTSLAVAQEVKPLKPSGSSVDPNLEESQPPSTPETPPEPPPEKPKPKKVKPVKKVQQPTIPQPEVPQSEKVEPEPLPAEEPETKPAKPVKKVDEFLRLKKDSDGNPVAMQTSIARYIFRDGNQETFVDLVGAVHIGDLDYYEQLNDAFEQYDVLLYELVAPPDRRIPTRDENEDEDLFVLVRRVAQILFEFEMQLEGIDYTKENFVHADLSPQEMAEKMKERGESMSTIVLGLITDMIRQSNLQAQKGTQEKYAEMDLMTVIRDPNGAIKFKRIMAEQMVDSILEADPQSTMNRLLIVDRNEATIEVLKRELGKGHKKIGIFYGAAHMPDFDQRLRLELDMSKQSERWVTAWDLKMAERDEAEQLTKYVKIAQLVVDYYQRSQSRNLAP